MITWNGNAPFPDPPTPFPKLSKYKNLAILADYVSAPNRVAERHKKGINVLYGHGGAKFVQLKAFESDINQCKDPFTHTYDPFQDNIWKSLDRQ